MKRLMAGILMLVLCLTGCAWAEEWPQEQNAAYADASADMQRPAKGTAVTRRMVDLTDAPFDNANVLMRYYPGVRVEVVRVADGQHVQVNVGGSEGGLMGYMLSEALLYGELAVRSVRALNVSYSVSDSFRLYSYCDTHADSTVMTYQSMVHALGGLGDWLHVCLDGSQTPAGFVSRSGEGLGDVRISYSAYVYTKPMEGELSVEEAVRRVKAFVLADGVQANEGCAPITAELLDACTVETEVMHYYSDDPTMRCFYHISFYYPEGTQGYPYICVGVDLIVEGMNIVSYDYGNG